MKIFFMLLLAIIATLVYRLVWADGGYYAYTALTEQVAMQQQSNAHLEQRNQALREEILDLRQGSEAVEERARYELGMIKNGETFYRIIGNSVTE